jgi:HAD superfamily hydrolase (TIGR01509 family)
MAKPTIAYRRNVGHSSVARVTGVGMARTRFFSSPAFRSRATGPNFKRSVSPVETPIPSKRLPELIIYDCDGTLVDSERLVAEVCLEEIHRLGLTHWTMQRYVDAFIGMPGHVGWSTVWNELRAQPPAGFNSGVDARIFKRFEQELALLPGVRETIEALPGPRCVASSTEKDRLLINIRKVGLDDLFGHHVFSASQVRRAKPAPDVFLFAASQMGHDPQSCLVVEDSVPGVLAARRAGMPVVGFTGAAHDPAVMAPKLAEAGAFDVIHRMQDLPRVVEARAAR